VAISEHLVWQPGGTARLGGQSPHRQGRRTVPGNYLSGVVDE
jgi:hypothetical protein